MKQTEILLNTDDAAADAGQDLVIALREYLSVVVSRWKLISLIVILSVALGLLHFYLTPPLYRAQTLLQLEQRSPLALDRESNPYLEAFLTQKYFPTQYELLKSRGLSERVVQALGLADDSRFAGQSASPDRATDEAALARLARRLAAGISVRPVQGTELVRVSYVSAEAELAAEITNTLAQEYINWSIEDRTQVVDKTSRFLQNELQKLGGEIVEKEKQLQEYSRRSDIVTLNPASNLTLQRLGQLNSDLLAAQAASREKRGSLRELESLPRESVANQELNGLIDELRGAQIRRQNEYDAKLKIYKPDWPEMVELRAAIDEGERAIAREVDKQWTEAQRRAQAEYQTELRKAQSIQREIDQVKAAALDLNSVSVEFTNLQSEISARRERRDDLLSQLETASMSARMFGERESNVRVVEKALVPGQPFRPSLRIDVTTGLSAGLGIGVALVLLLHFLDRTVKTPEELERLLNSPLLGVIPDVSERGRSYSYYGYGKKRQKDGQTQPAAIDKIELVPAKRSRLAVSEAYRSLRTALLLSSAEQLRLIAVTSAQSSEGKTATATNLAVVMAQLGKRVLIVDADLRKPRMYKVFDVSNRTGLVHYLTGTVRPETLCLPTSEANLFLCPAGPHPPNPSELLASDRMGSFLEFATQNFDFVIVDSPPVLAVTDAVLVGGKCQGTVLCFRSNKVQRADVQACRDRLRQADVRILGAVLNRYSPNRGGAYGRKYYYYQSYGEGEENSSAA